MARPGGWWTYTSIARQRALLHRRARHGSKRTEDAAITGIRSEQPAAVRAIVVVLTEVDGHRLSTRSSAVGTGNC